MLRVTSMLADSAQAVGGKLYVLGGGWSVTGPDPTPGAIVMDVKIPWDQRDEEFTLRWELVDSDGNPVLVPTPHGVQPLFMEANLKLEGEIDVKPGTPLDCPLAINYGPIPLAPGGRYEWRLTVNGESDEDWNLAYSTRPAAKAA